MKVWSIFIFALLMAFNVQVVAAEKSPQYTSELEVSAFYLSRDLTGYAKEKPCNSCKEIRHKITKDVKAFVNNKEVPLRRFVMSKQKPINLVFNRKTNKLVRMNWFIKR